MDFDEQKEVYLDKIEIQKALMGTLSDDTPLLEELGINLGIIKKESLMIFKVLNPKDIKVSFIEDADMSGPIIFILLYTLCLFVNCKMHFGYVYLISLISLFSIYFLLNVIDTVSIGLLQCCSVMGYSFVPMNIFSIINIFLNWSGCTFRIIMGILFTLWSSYISTTVFITYLGLNNKSIVIWYPLMLCYGCFSLLIVF